MLIALETEIAQFVNALFVHADPGTVVGLRSFTHDRDDRNARIQGFPLIGDDLTGLISAASRAATDAANAIVPLVFCPPIATFRPTGRAREEDLANGVCISVELDEGNTENARKRIEHLIGPATVVVASGGEWSCPTTGELHNKLHVHWRLSEPTRTPEDHAKLKRCRDLAMVFVGSDPTAVPLVHPLRWPGSWHRKGTPKLAMNAGGNKAAEVHLDEALGRLEEAVEAAGLRSVKSDAQPRQPGEPQASTGRLSPALMAIPNNDATHWDDWNTMGLRVHRATGGSVEGLDLWIAWSMKSAKYVAGECDARWEHFHGHPFGRSGAGTIFYLAKAHGWTEAKTMLEPPDDVPLPDYYDGADADGPMSEPALEGEIIPPGIAYPVLYFGEISASLDASDFVEGVFIEGDMSVVYGQSNSGKTFWMLDLALHVSSSLMWNGREVEGGGVIWVAMEGQHGIKNRVSAWRERHPEVGNEIPFAVIPCAVNLLDPDADTPLLIAAIKFIAAKLGVPVKLIVIDTLSRAIAGGNENSPEDMGALVTNGTAIQHATQAHVSWIHHSGKDEAKGARGHSLLRAATGTEIEISADGAMRLASTKKQRELECTGEFAFKLSVVELGLNRRRKAVTSCVVEASGERQAPGGASVSRRLTGHNKRAFEVLVDLVATSGQTGHDGTPPDVYSVPDKWWRERFYERAMPGQEPEARKKAFQRATTELLNQHMVGFEKGRVWLPYAQKEGKTDE